MNPIKRLMSNPNVVRFAYTRTFASIARKLGLTQTLKDLHHRSVLQDDGVYRTRFCGRQVLFRTRTPDDLVRVEYHVALLERKTLQILARGLRPGDTFLDVGADVGTFTIPAALFVGETGRVIAFEPEAESFEHLQDNVSLNQLRNVRAFKIALGEESSEGRLYVGQRVCPSLIAPDADHSAVGHAEVVQVANGDELWNAEGLPIPQAVKIDVEGFEYSVLRGLRKTLSDPRVKLLLCEIHPHLLPEVTSVEAVREFITSLGFTEAEVFVRTTEVYVIAGKEPSARGIM
jgi:FkbM family methyltransferase